MPIRERDTGGRRRLRVRAQGGFTLTELLISLVLGAFVIGGVLSVFLGGLETFRMTDSLSRMQESGRFAMELMRRDLREAGYVGCRNTLRQEAPRTDGPLDPGLIRNTLTPAPSGATDTLSFEYDFGVPLMAYEGTGDGSGSSWTAADDTAVAPTTVSLMTATVDGETIVPRDDSDIVVMIIARGAGITVRDHVGGSPPGSADIKVDGGSGIEEGDILLVTDCASAGVFAVTNINSSGGAGFDNIVHNTGSSTPGNYTKALGRTFVGAEVYRIERVAFFVADHPDTGRPTLYRTGEEFAEEIAENVQQLQLLYGVDTTFDFRVNDYVTAEQIRNDVNVSMDNVLAIRLNLLINSGEEDNLLELPASLTLAGGTFTAENDDLRLYRVFTATVGVRNRLP
ncbi:PilW family protein [Chromatocurvus halotolerans]|uniref:Type IV pilus assembly protein PilW n=1 Tax=Chromatocurvus halotolerans TaxID=1132028 RepID=A0A4R2KU37_9GAMM|nr:PilW family protein [Chromatocurvus halotolerans]TCO76307.1 type IV pilus assembly protein PilW [Chromatocurvus halotolerans]